MYQAVNATLGLHAKEAVCAASVQRWHSCLLASTRYVLRCVSHSIAPPLAPHATNLPAAAPRILLLQAAQPTATTRCSFPLSWWPWRRL